MPPPPTRFPKVTRTLIEHHILITTQGGRTTVKALLTANYDEQYLSQLRQDMDVEVAGFAVGDQLFAEDQLIERLSDKDVFIVGTIR